MCSGCILLNKCASPSNYHVLCCRILKIPTEELQHQFGTAIPENATELPTYARNFLEFCSYQALHMVTRRSNYLSDKEFRRLTFDMMLAWEAPGVEKKQLEKVSLPIIVTF